MTDEGVHVNTLKTACWTMKHKTSGRHFSRGKSRIFTKEHGTSLIK